MLKVDGVGEPNETISVDIDWGDGFVLLNQNVGVFAHQFDESVHQFTISVTLRDDRGGSVDETMTVSFEPPYENQAPAFVDVREISRSDYEVLMLALARDPEFEPISYRWRFDDGTPDILLTSLSCLIRFQTMCLVSTRFKSGEPMRAVCFRR